MERIAINNVLRAVDLNRPVALEASPIYLYPSRPSHHWDHPAFVQGWVVTESLRSSVESRATYVKRLEHWALLDDFNNKPISNVLRPNITEIQTKLIEQAPVLSELPLFENLYQDYRQGRVSWESEFFEGVRACDHLDSGFQIGKMSDYLMRPIIFSDSKLRDRALWEEIQPLPLLVITHPIDFRNQQEGMLTQLLGRMKHPPFSEFLGRLSTSFRKKLIENTFMHLWINDEGQVVSVTSPAWVNQASRFLHQEIGT